jgi:diguanylate cyclase (GGDEF)-like protein
MPTGPAIVTQQNTAHPSSRLTGFLVGYGLVAFCALTTAMAKLAPPSPRLTWLAVCFVAMYALADLGAPRLRINSQGITLGWNEAPLVLGLVALPGSEVVLTALLGKLIIELVQRRPAQKLALNVSKQAVAVSVAAAVCQAIGGPLEDPFTARGVLALLAAALVFAMISNASVIVAVGLATGASMMRLPVGRSELIAITGNMIAAFAGLAMFRFDPWLLLAIPPLMLCVRLIYKNRLRTKTERETWQRIAAAIDRFSDVDLSAVLRVAITSAAELFSASEVELEIRLGSEAPGLVRGNDREVSYAGSVVNAPGRSGTGVIEVPLGRQEETSSTDVSPGELRLRFDGKVRLNEREGYALRTFAAALGTALRNAYTYAEAEREAARHAHDAAHDPLTGLANRRHLLSYGGELLGAQPVRGTHAMVLIDLNHFKEVNDTLGHTAGDQVLTTIGRRLKAAAGPDDLVARLGGDEFAVLLVALPAPALAVHRARQMLATLDPSIEVDGITISVSGSAGVALAPVQGGVEELLRRSDVAMYQAKRDGVRLAQYNRSRDTADVSALALGGDLRRALAGDQFSVHYQPIVDLNSGAVVGAEALTRWRHPYRGEMSPQRFLAAIERSGLLPRFTEVVLDAALSNTERWRAAGHQIGISVNVSPRSLLDPGFPELVSGRLAGHDVPAGAVTLELTESLNLGRLDTVERVLAALRDMGVRIALDDFGTGASSLSTLARVPVDELKIDRSFIAGMLPSTEASAVVRSAVELGRSLDLSVVAEGVESQQQRALLFELGCPIGQGHLFSRPVPADRFGEILAHGGELAPSMSGDAQVIRIPPARLVRGHRL